ncbi:MAG: tetratricopeptide repeat protein [Planctomycetaceae bacterium]|nr:tetratricopeptide repeat protein [Planctomycetaceae bacterium]
MALIRLTILCVFLGQSIAVADDTPDAPPQRSGGSGGIAVDVQQVADDPAEPFVPKVPTPDAEKARQQAMTWYMTGQLREGRNDFKGALEAYRRAIEVAPAEIKPYQSLVTISYTENDRESAKKYALQAAEQSREGIPLARGLANLLVRASETSQAIEVLEKVQQSPPGDIKLVDELVLDRDLGLFNRLVMNTDTSVEHYRKVMSALQDAESALSPSERDEILGDAGETYEQMGKVFLDAKLADLAVTAFDEAGKFNKATPGIHSFNLAMVYKETEQPEKALEELDKYFDAQLQSKGREAYQLLADLLEGLGRQEELLPKLEELHDRDARNKSLAFFLADQYESQGHLDEAEELLKETVGRRADPRGLVGLASVYRRQHRPKPLLEAIAQAYQVVPQTEDAEALERMDSDMRALVERFPELMTEIAEDEEAMDGLVAQGRQMIAEDDGKLDFFQTYVLGKLSVQAERVEPAQEFYQLAIDMQNDPPAQLFLELADALTDAEKYGEAASVYGQATEHTSTNLQRTAVRSVFKLYQSHVLEMDGQTEAAIAAVAEARQGLPDNPRVRFQEAWIYYHAHRWEEAIDRFQEVIDTYGAKDDEESKSIVRSTRFSLSAVWVQVGNMVKGEEVLEVVLEQEPDNTQVNNDLGYLWADQGKNLEQAKTMIEKALAAEPENPAYLDSMGWVLFKLGDYEKAREYLEQAVNLPGGGDSTIFDHLGDAYDKLMQTEKAVELWQKAFDQEQTKPYPDDKILDRIKAKLPAEAEE